MAAIRARHFGCNVSGRPTSALLIDLLAECGIDGHEPSGRARIMSP
jgi:hypothetical protein